MIIEGGKAGVALIGSGIGMASMGAPVLWRDLSAEGVFEHLTLLKLYALYGDFKYELWLSAGGIATILIGILQIALSARSPHPFD